MTARWSRSEGNVIYRHLRHRRRGGPDGTGLRRFCEASAEPSPRAGCGSSCRSGRTKGYSKPWYGRSTAWACAAKIDNGLEVLYDEGPFAFLDKFNDRLRRTDVLWTKPSELVFYSGLGICPSSWRRPSAPMRSLTSAGWKTSMPGINPAGLAGCCHEWLFDLRESGGLAEAAWDGFLKVRKLGAFKIERLIRREPLGEGGSPPGTMISACP